MLRSETVDIWGNQKYVVASLLDGGAASMSGGVQIVRAVPVHPDEDLRLQRRTSNPSPQPPLAAA